METIKAIKKHSAQYDLYNRLHSISADESFVEKVAKEWYKGRFEVIANQRCGTWYCDPVSSSKAYAYFKSTDGHTNNWNFNLRRSNLPLATHAQNVKGFIIVDSTRRGKRMPDALSKTIPIWCTVINRAIESRRSKTAKGKEREEEWDTELYLPLNMVSPSEKAQIADILDVWAEALEASNLNLPDLDLPVRPFWVHPATNHPPQIPLDPGYIPIICCSASRWIGSDAGEQIPSVTRLEDRTVGFEYVQGAGDDHEAWGRGLTATLYHKHKSILLAADRDDLEETVESIVREEGIAKGISALHIADDQESTSSRRPIIGIPNSSSRLALDIGSPTDPTGVLSPSPDNTTTILILPIEKSTKYTTFLLKMSPHTALFIVPDAKTEPKAYSKALHQLVQHVRSLAEEGRSMKLAPGSKQDLEEGLKRLATPPPSEIEDDPHISHPIEATAEHRKLILPLALALMLAVPEVNSELVSADGNKISKDDIAKGLHLLVGLWPDGNPPRAALKRVNEYLMSPESSRK